MRDEVAAPERPGARAARAMARRERTGPVGLGIVGCGYVFDHYMASMPLHGGLEVVGVWDVDPARIEAVTRHYGLHAFDGLEAMLADPRVEVVVNLTSIGSHGAVTRAALEAGRHVYSEKPLVASMEEARALVALAEARGLQLSCAPSNALSATSRTMWKAVRDGAIGTPRMVYAEFDDNPIYLMSPEGWRSRTGAPWPYLHEYEAGCTWEHVGYHLTWMCAIFGPVRALTAFSKRTLPDKTDRSLDPPDTPDFSVACLDFASGVVGRVTCSIAAPYDHRMRIVGNRGMIGADTYRHYECPVRLEPFTKLSMNARKARWVRTSTALQAPFGVGGRRVPLAVAAPPGSRARPPSGWSPGAVLGRWKSRQLGRQDKSLGIAELARAWTEGDAPFPSHDFTLHLTELTLAIQAAGPDGASVRPTTSFDPVKPPRWALSGAPDYGAHARPGVLDRLSEGLLDRMHRH